MSEVLEEWPVAQLGIGLMQGYRYKHRPNKVETKMSAGMPKSRLTSRDVITDHFFALQLTAEQLYYFEWWVHNKIDQGEAHFKIPLLFSFGVPDAEAKFVKIGEPRPRSGQFVIQCQVVTRHNPAHAVTEVEALAVLANGINSLQP